MHHQRIKYLRQQLLKENKAQFEEVNPNFDEKLERILNGLIGENVFVTLFDYINYKYCFHYNIEELLGYSNKEFNIYALNNDAYEELHVTHPDDQFHKIRFDNIVYRLLSSEGFKFRTLRDHYSISFRLYDKARNVKQVIRRSFVFAVKNNQPITQIDLWTVQPPKMDGIVRFDFGTPYFEEVHAQFHKLNCEELDFRFTPTENRVLHYKCNNLSNAGIAAKMYLTEKSIQNHLQNMRNKVRCYLYPDKNLQPKFSTLDLLGFVTKYGLYPVPSFYLNNSYS